MRSTADLNDRGTIDTNSEAPMLAVAAPAPSGSEPVCGTRTDALVTMAGPATCSDTRPDAQR